MSLDTATEGSFGQLARAASKMMDQMHKGFFVVTPDTWTPNVNLYETTAMYFVCADLAGVEKEKIDIEVIDGMLTLRGCRTVPSYEAAEFDDVAPADAAAVAEQGGGDCEPKQLPASADGGAEAEPAAKRARVHLMEIDHGTFNRQVELPPDADHARIAANYRNGLLWIQIPKK